MNGLEFLSELRSDDKLKDIKVFVMTTSDQEQDKIASKELGVSGYIIKPLNLNYSSSSKDSFNLFIDLMNLRK